MQIKEVAISKLNPAKYNPRKDLQPDDPEYQKLKRSIEEFGEVDPIVWNQATGNIVGGHQRYKILKEMGRKKLKVSVVDLTEKAEAVLNVALNKISGEWDYPKLKDLISEIDTGEFDIELTGFDQDELDHLFGYLNPPIANGKDDNIPEVPKNAITQIGDLYRLGNHYLLCGDCTDDHCVSTLLPDSNVDITFTSPPYNAYKNAHIFENKYLGYNDNVSDDEYLSLLNNFTKIAIKKSAYVFCVLQLLTHNRKPIIKYQHDNLKYLKDVFIWKKNIAPPQINKGTFNNKWEYVLCFSEDSKTKKFPVGWQGKYSDVIECDGIEHNEFAGVHSAVFPVALPVWLMEKLQFAKTVYDPFAGTGTTLIACEKMGVKCFSMDIIPIYCDIIIKRWEEFTGKTAELINNSEKVIKNAKQSRTGKKTKTDSFKAA